MNNSILLLTILLFGYVNAQDNSDKIDSAEYTYKVIDSDSLKAFVFFPVREKMNDACPSIVIFHGGGWSIGEPSWAFKHCEKYAKMGMVSIAAQYRLSDQKSITPIDAMEDARDIIIWMRKNSGELNIKINKIAAYGWSAGAHLAASSAVFPTYTSDSSMSSIPNALILHSPALSVTNDGWFKTLLLDKGVPLDFSPAEHIKGNMPPSIIVVGKDDTVTPVGESKLFHHNMLKNGNLSYLYIFDNAGHLFTPSDQPDDGWPDPDKEIESKAFHEIDLFLRSLEFIK